MAKQRRKVGHESPNKEAEQPAARTERSRLRQAGTWVLEILLAIALLWGLTRWQARRLLPTRTAAPDFTLTALDGSSHSLTEAKGRTTVLYFFAPWCTVCAYASSNVNALRKARSESVLAIYAIGLEWEDEAALRRFASEHNLTVPVLRGDEQLRKAYHVDTFPTVYVLDAEGAVQDRVVGYTSELGLRLRSL
jgi:peroxiredoxin